MATMNQLRRRPRRQGAKKVGTGGVGPMGGGPHRRGVCRRIYQRSPKKPNSANRWVARVRRVSPSGGLGPRVTAHVPGEGHGLQEHARVLLRGGRVKDLPGVQHRVVRGAYDCTGVGQRRTSRSKYGAPKPRGATA